MQTLKETKPDTTVRVTKVGGVYFWNLKKAFHDSQNCTRWKPKQRQDNFI